MNTKLAMFSLIALPLLLISGCGGSDVDLTGLNTSNQEVDQEDDSNSSNDDSDSSNDDGDDTTNSDTPQVDTAIQTSLFTESGNLSEIVMASSDDKTVEAEGIAQQDASDLRLETFDGSFFQIGRYGLDFIARYDFGNPKEVTYQYSTLPSNDSSTTNPYAIGFVSKTKAYVALYGSDQVLIINPNAKSSKEFQIGQVDLSQYDDGDGSPEATDVIVIEDKLYVLMQRLDNFVPTNTAYVAVIDTKTDQEIDTSANEQDLNGIALKTRNPQKFVYDQALGLFVQSVGDYGNSFADPPRNPAYTGGIEEINLSNYSTQVILDDGDSGSHPYGQFNDFEIVDANTAYVVGYDGWEDNTLYRFDLSAQTAPSVVDEQYANIYISGLGAAPDGALWVLLGDEGNPHIDILDSTNQDQYITSLQTNYPPVQVVFMEQ